MRLVKIVAVLTLAAAGGTSCGTDRLTNPLLPAEAGSISLQVNADLQGSEDIGSGTFSSTFGVTIRDSLGQSVNDAQVVLIDPGATSVNLARDTLTPGRYAGSRSGYTAGLWFLHVRRGSDSLVNAGVQAPDIHVITFPTTNDTLDSTQPFTVRWTRQVAAEQVQIETRDFGPSLIAGAFPDSGAYSIPASNRVRNDQRVRIWRTNSVELVTGLPSSTFRAEIRNAVEPIVVQ